MDRLRGVFSFERHAHAHNPSPKFHPTPKIPKPRISTEFDACTNVRVPACVYQHACINEWVICPPSIKCKGNAPQRVGGSNYVPLQGFHSMWRVISKSRAVVSSKFTLSHRDGFSRFYHHFESRSLRGKSQTYPLGTIEKSNGSKELVPHALEWKDGSGGSCPP